MTGDTEGRSSTTVRSQPHDELPEQRYLSMKAARLKRGETEPPPSMTTRHARPIANIASPATTAVTGSVATSVTQPTSPTHSARAASAPLAALRPGRGVGDRVVRQHAEGREGDRAARKSVVSTRIVTAIATASPRDRNAVTRMHRGSQRGGRPRGPSPASCARSPRSARAGAQAGDRGSDVDERNGPVAPTGGPRLERRHARASCPAEHEQHRRGDDRVRATVMPSARDRARDRPPRVANLFAERRDPRISGEGEEQPAD